MWLKYWNSPCRCHLYILLSLWNACLCGSSGSILWSLAQLGDLALVFSVCRKGVSWRVSLISWEPTVSAISPESAWWIGGVPLESWTVVCRLDHSISSGSSEWSFWPGPNCICPHLGHLGVCRGCQCTFLCTPLELLSSIISECWIWKASSSSLLESSHGCLGKLMRWNHLWTVPLLWYPWCQECFLFQVWHCRGHSFGWWFCSC